MELSIHSPATDSQPASYQLSTYLMRHCPRGVQDRSWLAEIVGTHPRYRLERRFIKSQKHQSRSTHDGTQIFAPLYSGKVYQYAAIAENGSSGYQYQKGNHLSGYFIISAAGEMDEITADDAISHAATLTPKAQSV
ncbi:MAG TPA: hypothetical protein VHC22_32360 [Pirellulales bacterium]|nr:hypothetical protein [Pirellulales bacterium]